MMSPEGHEKKAIDAYLKSIGAYVVKPTTMGFGASGTPDRVCCIGSKFVTIEVKRAGKEPTAIQDRRMAEVRAAGGWAFWGTADKIISELKGWM